MAKIILKGMRFFAHHGVTEVERRLGQVFIVDLELEIDASAAAAADDLSSTIDYDQVYQQVDKVVSENSFMLIETLAVRIAAAVREATGTAEVKVRVKKPGAPIAGEFDWVGVEV